MRDFSDIAYKVMEEACGGDEERVERMQPIFSLDNDPVHEGADAIVGPPGTASRVLLPPRSPDMHKVIEHIFNTVSYKLKHDVFPVYASDPVLCHSPPEHFWDVIHEELNKITLDSIRADILSLHMTRT